MLSLTIKAKEELHSFLRVKGSSVSSMGVVLKLVVMFRLPLTKITASTPVPPRLQGDEAISQILSEPGQFHLYFPEEVILVILLIS